ncbi:unnamed protein product [Prorocentrum cordatum]|uniref:Uncharacterized protein n=1 Tax=Prorocentrum cordatum TaxID=2364126 RepID=A0ABN9TNU1_9DINO|nr:unnamed protein product [Polarella glacialis]
MVPPPLAARLAASRAGPVALRRAQARVPAAVPPSCRRAGARGVMMFMDCQAHSSPMALLLSGRAELHTTAVLQSGTENANMNSIADPFDMPFEDSDEGGESDGEEPCEGAQAEPPAASAEADEKRAGLGQIIPSCFCSRREGLGIRRSRVAVFRRGPPTLGAGGDRHPAHATAPARTPG